MPRRNGSLDAHLRCHFVNGGRHCGVWRQVLCPARELGSSSVTKRRHPMHLAPTCAPPRRLRHVAAHHHDIAVALVASADHHDHHHVHATRLRRRRRSRPAQRGARPRGLPVPDRRYQCLIDAHAAKTEATCGAHHRTGNRVRCSPPHRHSLRSPPQYSARPLEGSCAAPHTARRGAARGPSARYRFTPMPSCASVTADLYVPAMSGLRLGSRGSTSRASVVRDM